VIPGTGVPERGDPDASDALGAVGRPRGSAECWRLSYGGISTIQIQRRYCTHLDLPHALGKFTLLEGVFRRQQTLAVVILVLFHVIFPDVVLVVRIAVHVILMLHLRLGRLLRSIPVSAKVLGA
jgi:hypothetical protein